MILPELRSLISKIRNETKNKGNTKIRVADTLDGMIDFVNSKFIRNSSESLTQLGTPTITDNTLNLGYTGEDGIEQKVSVDLSTILSKVGQTGDYGDLLNKPDFIPLAGTEVGKPVTGSIEFLETDITNAKSSIFYDALKSNGYLLSETSNRVDTTGSFNLFAGTAVGRFVTTGNRNTLVGSYSGSKVTTGRYNTTIGTSAGYALTEGEGNTLLGASSAPLLTTGNQNTSIGQNSMKNGTTGYKNTIVGSNAGDAVVSSALNTIIGYKSSGVGVNIGDLNILIGLYAGYNLKAGSKNNLFIGNFSNGTAATALNNKLVIHNNTTIAGYDAASANGNPTNQAESTIANALISGDFLDKWVNIGGKLSITPTLMPVGDSTYTKNVVAKPDGTFGWENKISVPAPPATGTFKLRSVNGVMSWVADV
jgi:hypothetical protein